LDDPNSEIAKLSASLTTESLHPEFETDSLVQYVGIPKRFVAGEVVYKGNEGECAPGVKVTLSGGGQNLETVTDIFGDFEFEGLDKSQKYQVVVAVDGYADKKVDFTTYKDVNLGEIVLEAK
jgi:hypothetical protein